MENIASKAREIAHAAVAVIGALAASAALLASLLAAVGVHVTDMQIVQGLGIAGGIAALASKLIDSANDAMKGSA